jgi:hypothetical protein
MPLVFVLARDWTLRTAVRAELGERGIQALGMDSPDDAGRVIAAGQMPAAIVLEGTSELVTHPAIRELISRVPTVWIASRTERIPETAGPPKRRGPARQPVGIVLYRPVSVGEIVSRVLDLLEKGQAA